MEGVEFLLDEEKEEEDDNEDGETGTFEQRIFFTFSVAIHFHCLKQFSINKKAKASSETFINELSFKVPQLLWNCFFSLMTIGAVRLMNSAKTAMSTVLWSSNMSANLLCCEQILQSSLKLRLA